MTCLTTEHALFIEGPWDGRVEQVNIQPHLSVAELPKVSIRDLRNLPDRPVARSFSKFDYRRELYRQRMDTRILREAPVYVPVNFPPYKLDGLMDDYRLRSYFRRYPVRWRRPKLLDPNGVNECCDYICHKLGIHNPDFDRRFHYEMGERPQSVHVIFEEPVHGPN